MRIWAKTMRDDKITRERLHERTGRSCRQLLESALRDICEALDIPTPIVLASHYHNFDTFSVAKFTTADFVESIDFDHMIIENITE